LLMGSKKRRINGTGKMFPKREIMNTSGQGRCMTNMPVGIEPRSSQIGVAAMRKTQRYFTSINSFL